MSKTKGLEEAVAALTGDTPAFAPGDGSALVSASAAAATEVPDGHKLYAVRPGVTEIAGRKLRGATEVALQPVEAEYALSIESLAPAGDWPASWGDRPVAAS